MVHDLVKGPLPDHPQLQCSNGIHLPRAHVPCVQERPVQAVAALPQDLPIRLSARLPEYHVVPWLSRHVDMAREVHHLQLFLRQQAPGCLDRHLQVLLRVLVDVDAKQKVPPAHEFHLWGRVMEPHHLHHIPQSVTVQPYNAMSIVNIYIKASGDF